MDLLKVENLSVYSKQKTLINNISFTVEKNKILGITGESGAGKSILIKSIIRLLDEKRFSINGKIIFNGEDLLKIKLKEIRKIRGKEIGVVFQNPMTAFNPNINIREQMVETIKAHKKISKKQAIEQIKEILTIMKFKDLDRILNSFPCNLSGGMMQRIVIANILLLKPKILIADEPTTALDKENRKIIIDELLKIKREFNVSIIFISHDYEILKEISDEILILKNGEKVAFGKKEDLLIKEKNVYIDKLFF